MKKWIVYPALFCLLLISYYPAATQTVVVWTEKGCNATYKPGDTVKIHYKVFDSGWTKVAKQWNTHQEEIASWKYFPTGGEYTETDTLGPECGTITYEVTFWQEVSPACCCFPCGWLPCCECFPCNGCGPSVYVMEMGKSTCSIKVQCDMSVSIFTDKIEYISGVDSKAQITLGVTDSQGGPLDVDSVVIDVNGEGIKSVKSSAGLYNASFFLSAKSQGEYIVTANIFKKDYPRMVETTQFAVVIPVTVELSTDKTVYTPGSEAVIRAQVQDASGKGVGNLHFDVSVSDVTVSCTELGSGIYRARVDLTGFEQGSYIFDISSMEDHVRVDYVDTAEVRVGGLPELVIEVDPIKVKTGSPVDGPVLLTNTGEGEASNIAVFIEAPPELDISISGYSYAIPPGGQTTAFVLVTGKQKGEHTANVDVSYRDVGGNTHTVKGSFLVTVTSDITVILVIAAGAVAAVAGAFILIRTGKSAENSKNGEKKASETPQSK